MRDSHEDLIHRIRIILSLPPHLEFANIDEPVIHLVCRGARTLDAAALLGAYERAASDSAQAQAALERERLQLQAEEQQIRSRLQGALAREAATQRTAAASDLPTEPAPEPPEAEPPDTLLASAATGIVHRIAIDDSHCCLTHGSCSAGMALGSVSTGLKT